MSTITLIVSLMLTLAVAFVPAWLYETKSTFEEYGKFNFPQ
jgi:hypothetical protein